MLKMTLNFYFKVYLFHFVTISALAVESSFIEKYFEPDFIECYWCNSRDVYCGKRVTDTMVTTIKCPKHSKCTVYTNPYDNYYLHRGCSYGMDLGQIQVENGCFVEEEGSTYCFCDFNRCNAAGILDLRNLIENKQNESNAKIKLFNNLEIEKDGFIKLNTEKTYDTQEEISSGSGSSEQMSNELNMSSMAFTSIPLSYLSSSTSSSSTSTSTSTTSKAPISKPTSPSDFTASRILITTTNFNPTSSASHLINKNNSNGNMLNLAATKINKFSSLKNSTIHLQGNSNLSSTNDVKYSNLDQLLMDYLKFSKSVSSNLIKESIKNQIMKNFKGNDQLLKKLDSLNGPKNSTEPTDDVNNKELDDPTIKSKSIFDLKYKNLTSQYVSNSSSAQSTTQTTTTTTTPTTTTSTYKQQQFEDDINANSSYLPTTYVPNLYKLNINDTYSKNLLDNHSFRSKLGLKTNDKLSILIKKPYEEPAKYGKLSLVDTKLNNNQHNNQFLFNNLNPIILQKTKQPQMRPQFGGSRLQDTSTSSSFQSTTTQASQQFFSKVTASFNLTTTTVSSWLSKLKAKLQSQSNEPDSQNKYLIEKPTQIQHFQKPLALTTNQNRFQSNPFLSTSNVIFEKQTNPFPFKEEPQKSQNLMQSSNYNNNYNYNYLNKNQQYDWTHVLTEKYKQDLNVIHFSCPKDGLFAHPTNCQQFLQCIDYGTIYNRFYVLNCPAGLYFNTKLDLCDYPQNVLCQN